MNIKIYNQITIDLSGVKNKDQTLHKLDEVFEFGGSKNWGFNWDALSDSLSYLSTGGIHGTGKKFEFPLKIIFENSNDLEQNDKDSFETLKKIFINKMKQSKVENEELIVEFA